MINRCFRVGVLALTLCMMGLVAVAQTTVRVAVGSVAQELEVIRVSAEAFERETGIKVELVPMPSSATERLALYQQQLGASSPDIDVYQIDVVWPGQLGQFFIDLAPFVTEEERAEFFPRLIENNTVGGRLVALPWFTETSMLFYRTDLLEKYGFEAPPETWDELEAMARTIQEGERAAGNPNFWGFVWQGASYEGLTCVALEWVASEGGGTIVDGDANITINNPDAVRALARAARWVGGISPPGVTAYQEEEARGVFQGGNAAFMRNWTYAIATGNSEGSPIAGKFDVTMLPRGTGPNARHAATLGGWQLAVSRFSRQPQAAAALVEYFTNAETLKMRAIRGAFPPTRPDLYTDAEILAAQPFLENMRTILPTAVARPANVTQTSYNRVSVAFYQAVHSVLQGRTEPEAALRQLAQQLERVKGRRGF